MEVDKPNPGPQNFDRKRWGCLIVLAIALLITTLIGSILWWADAPSDLYVHIGVGFYMVFLVLQFWCIGGPHLKRQIREACLKAKESKSK